MIYGNLQNVISLDLMIMLIYLPHNFLTINLTWYLRWWFMQWDQSFRSQKILKVKSLTTRSKPLLSTHSHATLSRLLCWTINTCQGNMSCCIFHSQTSFKSFKDRILCEIKTSDQISRLYFSACDHRNVEWQISNTMFVH